MRPYAVISRAEVYQWHTPNAEGIQVSRLLCQVLGELVYGNVGRYTDPKKHVNSKHVRLRLFLGTRLPFTRCHMYELLQPYGCQRGQTNTISRARSRA